MKLITRKTDVQYLSGIEFDMEGEIELLIGPQQKYILCDPRTSDQLRVSHPDWTIVDTREGHTHIIQQARKIEIDATHIPMARYHQLHELNPRITPKDHPISKLRVIKTSDEIKKLIASQRLNEDVLRQICPYIRIGMTEIELEQLIKIEILKQGAQTWSFTPIVAFEENGANPHHQNSDRKLKEGDQILLDFGSTLDGYCSDMTRIVFSQTPTRQQEEILDILIHATEQAISHGRVGMKFSELHAYVARLLGNYRKYFIHSLGHGIGRDIHELPSISPKRHGKIQNGMVFTIEPGIYMPGKIGSRFEQIVVVEDGTLRCITEAPEKILLSL